VILDFFANALRCKPGGSLLQSEVHRREKASALTLLLAVERIGVAERVSDVLREVIMEYACFDLVDTDVDGGVSTRRLFLGRLYRPWI
jgi:2-polyprenyl-3-methyl-5-hydroxy-6-metoxy-1,4-benzoquinol methylase